MLAILTILTFAALSAPEQASAAPTVNEPTDNTCLSCHEKLYYLHDAGCWYCMVDSRKNRCTDCHEGNAASSKMEESHVGMLRHPQENNGAKCKECHATDVDARLNAFDAKGGFEQVIQPVAYTPRQSVELGFPETARSNIAEKLPWAAGGIVIFGFWLALVLHPPQKP